jgi:hypothetical protein
MSAVDLVLQVFRSVEERDPQLAAEVYHDDLEFHWPRPLPYAGSSYGLKASLGRRPGWAQTWDPFQSPGQCRHSRVMSEVRHVPSTGQLRRRLGVAHAAVSGPGVTMTSAAPPANAAR